MEVLFLGNALLAQELPLSYPLRDSFQSCSSKKQKPVKSKYIETRKEHDIKAEQLTRVSSEGSGCLSAIPQARLIYLILERVSTQHCLCLLTIFWIETYVEYFNLVCGDQEIEGLTSFICDVSKQGKPHQDLEVNMCRSSCQELKGQIMQLLPQILLNPFFFIFERRLQYSAMCSMRYLFTAKHSTTKRLIKNKISLAFCFA